MPFQKADRLKALPPYLFAEIDRKKRGLIAEGHDVINLGVGDSDLPTPDFIVDELSRAAREPKNHPYSFDDGLPEFRTTFATWFHKRFNVELNPSGEIYPTIGSKEGIAHLSLAVLNPGDVSLTPELLYPVYRSGALFCNAEPVYVPMRAENDFLLDLGAIKPEDARRAKMLWVCYPNNPTAVLATREFYKDVVAFAKKYDLIVASDCAYSELYYEEPPVSILETPGAKDVAVEFHSMSKTFNMTGWRVGCAVGNKDIIAALAQVKANCDSGIFMAIQRAGIAAYRDGDAEVARNRQTFKDRRDALAGALSAAGWQAPPPPATFYCWVKCPQGVSSAAAAERILLESHTVVTPGHGFGTSGEGYIRMTITQPKARLLEAVERIKKLKF